MQHEALEVFLSKQDVHPLHVFLGAKGRGCQSLRFAPREKCGAMYAR